MLVLVLVLVLVWVLVVVVSGQLLLEANPVAWGGRQCEDGLMWTLGRQAASSLQWATGQLMAHMDIYIYILPIKIYSAILS